jgi:ribosomal protein S18 acetylase RimI-like enzyme
MIMPDELEEYEIRRGNILITTDQRRLDLDAIHDFLSTKAYWSLGIPRDLLARSIANSLSFGLFVDGVQVGFARVVSDFSTVAYLGDVYVLESHRRQGLSQMMMEAVMSHPSLKDLRRWILLTSTAGWLYEKFGFVKLGQPEIYMERFDPQVYQRLAELGGNNNDGDLTSS